MKVALFVPCFIDQLYPEVAIATLRVLERAGCEVEYPPDQTCCGQPMANAGHERDAASTMRNFVRTFAGYEHIVAPSGSCVAHVRAHYGRSTAVGPDGGPARADDDAGAGWKADVRAVRERTFELCQVLTDVLDVRELGASFPHRVGLHPGCHALRMLGLARPSEIQAPPFDRVRDLLQRVDGLELVELDRPDECCGFGGTFAVTEAATSAKMGRDRIRDHVEHGAEVIVSTDMSCLMHLDGLIRRDGSPVRVLHVAEVLDTVGPERVPVAGAA
ncbi:MAG: (Fe-S)-binding protein [Gemmatimonadota bacterium]